VQPVDALVEEFTTTAVHPVSAEPLTFTATVTLIDPPVVLATKCKLELATGT
jgi:hypothetical protein